VGDLRESPALTIIEELAARGAVLSYHDPYVPSLPELGLENRPIDEVVAAADAVVLVTAHPGIDHVAVAERSGLFVDLRGVTSGQRTANVERL
jgi:UDP-N-acetyl-D-glucosamine dehydrogenase